MILVGTSGWSYGSWVGPVYPRHLGGRRSEWLAHYATTFPTVEVNTTFYQLPLDRVVRGWVDTAVELDGFELTLKAPRKVTHRAMVRGDVEAAREGLAAFLDRTRPIRDAGVQGAILVQLPPSFQAGPGEIDVLDAALDALDEAGDVAVELRHRSWVRDAALHPGAADVLASRGAAPCIVDGPPFPTLEEPFGDHAYVRFHGRRDDVWFDASDLGRHARYDYRYDDDELAAWVDTLRGLDQRSERVRVYFNNHPDGKAFRDADRLREMLGLERPDRTVDGQRRLDAF